MLAAVVDRLPAPARHLVERLRQDDVLMLAAGLAFYALVSLAPLLVLSLRLATLIAGEDAMRRAGDALAGVAPDKLGVDKAFTAVARAGAGIGPTAVLAALWPATAYGAGLIRAFDRMTGSHRPLRGLRGRALALLLVGLLPAFVLTTLGAVAVAPRVLGDGLVAELAGWLLGLALALGMLTAFHAVVYRVFAPDDPAAPAVLKGALLSAAAVTVLSLVYGLYLRFGADFGARYITSGVAAVVLLAVWLFLANALLLVGYRAAVDR